MNHDELLELIDRAAREANIGNIIKFLELELDSLYM